MTSILRAGTKGKRKTGQWQETWKSTGRKPTLFNHIVGDPDMKKPSIQNHLTYQVRLYFGTEQISVIMSYS